MIHISQYDQNKMELAKPVYDGKRRILLAAGRTIHPVYLEKLKELKISTLIVEDMESTGITLEEMVDMPTWMDAIEIVRDVYENVASNKPIPLVAIQKMVSKLVAEVKQRRIILLFPTSSLPIELFPYAHAVNVTLLSLQVARHLQYNELQLHDLAIGCLLHDIGKAHGRESEKHCEAGFSILRKMREISLLSAHIAYQHHETMDGKGYPRGIRGEEFLEFAQICAVTNLFENFISVQHMPPHEAIERIMALSGSAYLPSIIEAFVRKVPAYPPGTKLLLHNGEEAIVTQITTHMQRPVVRIFSTDKEISLADNPTIVVKGLAHSV
ncbi:HD-GYP domain-containing protein [Aneurinibacillus terranovensis]|uniref:HD-GYP domain-containing protein n=1 Tax=Aneurinibacillus terranovensis TaxID=278991 RepID=UPI00316ADD80